MTHRLALHVGNVRNIAVSIPACAPFFKPMQRAEQVDFHDMFFVHSGNIERRRQVSNTEYKENCLLTNFFVDVILLIQTPHLSGHEPEGRRGGGSAEGLATFTDAQHGTGQ